MRMLKNHDFSPTIFQGVPKNNYSIFRKTERPVKNTPCTSLLATLTISKLIDSALLFMDERKTRVIL